MAKKKRNRSSSQRPQGRPTSTREQKRQQFSAPARRSPLVWVVPVVVVVVIAVATTIALASSHKSANAQNAAVSAGSANGSAAGGAGGTSGTSGVVKIPVSQVSDGKVHFFTSDMGGTTVQYFVIKAPDGSLRTAFNACDVCYPYKKGYHQQGAAVQCNNCGRVFDAAQIDVQRGGCNPGPISAKVVGSNLVIPASQLQNGVRYF